MRPYESELIYYLFQLVEPYHELGIEQGLQLQYSVPAI